MTLSKFIYGVAAFVVLALASSVAFSGANDFSRGMNGWLGQGLTDFAGRQGYMSVFGEQVVGSREDDISVQFQYNNSVKDLVIGTPTGTGGQSNINSMMHVSAGTGVGDQTVESLNSTRYRPGHELMSHLSARFVGDGSNVSHYIGLGDDQDRLAIGTSEGVFGIWFREGGNETFTPQTSFSIDTIDGAKGQGNQSGFDLIPENENVFMISYGWLGVTPIYYYVYGGHSLGWLLFHVIDPTNELQEPHLDNPSLPMFTQVTRSSGSGVEAFIETGSWRAGVVSGAVEDNSSDRWSAFFNLDVAVVSTANTGSHIISLRSKSLFQSKSNHVKTLVKTLRLASTYNKDVVIVTVPTSVLRTLDPVFAAALDAAYVDIDPDNSVIENAKLPVTVDITGLTDADIIDVVLIRTLGTVENLNILGTNLYPSGEVSYITLPPTSGTGTVSLQGRFVEQF